MRTLTEERRQAIIDAASQLFQEMGYERASMNEVAKRVGGSKATLYNYFSSKEELFETVVRTYSTRFLTDAASQLTAANSKGLNFEQKLTQFGEGMLQVLSGDNQALQIYRVVVGEAGHSDIGKLFRESGSEESMEKLAQTMAEAMAKGELGEGEPMLRAQQFTSLVKSEVDVVVLQRELPRFSDAQIKVMVKNAVRLFLYGALPQQDNNAR
ncbi:TetR/AcrR family transcriptional regulator [Affinibrenneria salicis]|uniref:TetR/AcrR family transcriptional regulator n=1 Tax=Affinibrenneria salicis TaxID=2590031 RepID=A0A5J5G363_9GAMM|nr:TetR/AcrR family transcriptional regulator [Affinibrenneria salicis]KAA9001345.1 TetR/AcrR family transcriptional regulator [Affinibrenneria salicis]